MTTSRQIEASLSHSILEESEETNLTPRDTGVLQTVMEEGLTVFTFDGVKRLTGLHQEKLARIIDRVEEDGLLEKVDEGYGITARGNVAVSCPLSTAVDAMAIVELHLPSGFDR